MRAFGGSALAIRCGTRCGAVRLLLSRAGVGDVGLRTACTSRRDDLKTFDTSGRDVVAQVDVMARVDSDDEKELITHGLLSIWFLRGQYKVRRSEKHTREEKQ